MSSFRPFELVLRMWWLSCFVFTAIANGEAIYSAPPQRAAEETIVHRWDGTTPSVSISVENTDAAPLAILSVQSSQGLTVRSFPAEVAPGGKAAILLDVTPVSGAAGGRTQVRVITSHWAAVYSFKHVQEPIADLEPRTLAWTATEPLTHKTAKLRVAAAFIRSVSVSVSTTDAEARLSSGAMEREFLVEVTPSPSARGSAFTVQINFDPEIPQPPLALGCSVAP